MGKLVWDKDGERLYETGVRNGVLYVRDSNGAYLNGVAWNGLTSVSESPEGAEATALYADDIKYLNLISNEDFKATIEAYTYPEEFEQCDGTAALATGVNIGQQARKTFGLSYRTTIGNDIENNDYGYKLHCIYGALASPSEKAYETINDSPEAITFSWEINTTPVNVKDINGRKFKPTALLTVDSTKVNAAKLAALEAILYGTDEFDAAKTYAVGDTVEHSATHAWDANEWNALTVTAFSAAQTYEVGDYVTNDTKLYKCKTAITSAAAWDETKWDEVEFTTFSTSESYVVGDVVKKDTSYYSCKTAITAGNAVYTCKTAITSAAAWDDTKWTEVGQAGPRLPLPDEVATIFA